MKLVDDIDTLWKRWSTRIAGIQLTAALTYWALIPAEWKAAVPNWVLLLLVGIFGAAFMGAQAVKQPSLNKDDGPP